MAWRYEPDGPYGGGGNHTSPADEFMKMAKMMRYFEKKDEVKTKKKEEAEKEKKKKEGEKKVEMPKIDVFKGALILLLFSPIIGPTVLSLQISAYKHITEMITTLVK